MSDLKKDLKRSRFSCRFRAIAAMLVASMLCQDLLYAAPDLKLPQLTTQTLELDPSLGTVQEVSPPNDKLIYLIQDGHTNESAQRNIAEILRKLVEKDKVSYVFLEAGTGDDSLSDLRPLASAKVRKHVADIFLRRAHIQGPDYLDLTSELDLRLWGVEDKALYHRGIELYRSLKKGRNNAFAWLDKLERAVRALKDEVFGAELLEFDKVRSGHQKGDLAIDDYLDTLWSTAQRSGIGTELLRNIALVREVKRNESTIDFERPDDEDLQRYLDNAGLASKIKPEDLISEIAWLEERVHGALAKTHDERELLRAARAAETLRRLVGLKATSEDIKAIESDPAAYDAAELGGFLNAKIMELERNYESAIFLDAAYQRTFDDARAFYALTKERDQHFLENILAKMDETGQSKAAFVAGGFHTENLKRLFKEKNISYVSIIPHVTQETNMRRYEELLLGQLIPSSSAAAKMTAVPPAADMMLMVNGASTSAKELLRRELVDRSKAAVASRTPSGARLARDHRPKRPDPDKKIIMDALENVDSSLESIIQVIQAGARWLEAKQSPFERVARPFAEDVRHATATTLHNALMIKAYDRSGVSLSINVDNCAAALLAILIDDNPYTAFILGFLIPIVREASGLADLHGAIQSGRYDGIEDLWDRIVAPPKSAEYGELIEPTLEFFVRNIASEVAERLSQHRFQLWLLKNHPIPEGKAADIRYMAGLSDLQILSIELLHNITGGVANMAPIYARFLGVQAILWERSFGRQGLPFEILDKIADGRTKEVAPKDMFPALRPLLPKVMHWIDLAKPESEKWLDERATGARLAGADLAGWEGEGRSAQVSPWTAFGLLSSLLFQRSSHESRAREAGLKINTTAIGYYLMLLYVFDLDPKTGRQMNFDRVLWTWFQFMRLADHLLDLFGSLYSLDELENILRRFEETGEFEFDLISKRSKEDKIYKKFARNERFIETAGRRLDEMIDKMPLDQGSKAAVRRIFDSASISLFRSYLLERKYGLDLSPTQNLEIIRAKAGFSQLLALRPFLNRSESGKDISFYENTILFLTMMDDLVDAPRDITRQPNIYLTFSRSFPKEHRRILRSRIGFHGPWAQVWMLIFTFHSYARTMTMMREHWSAAFRQRPLASMAILGYAVSKYLQHSWFGAYPLFNQARMSPDATAWLAEQETGARMADGQDQAADRETLDYLLDRLFPEKPLPHRQLVAGFLTSLVVAMTVTSIFKETGFNELLFKYLKGKYLPWFFDVPPGGVAANSPKIFIDPALDADERRQILAEEAVHRMVRERLLFYDIPLASAIVDFYRDEIETSVAEERNPLNEGRAFFLSEPDAEKRWKALAARHSINGVKDRNDLIFSSIDFDESLWTYDLARILAGFAKGIVSKTGRQEDGWRYLADIAKGDDPIEVEARLLKGADGARLADIPQLWHETGGVVLTDKEVDSRIKRVPDLKALRVAVIELEPGDSIPFAGEAVKRFQEPRSKNTVRFFTFAREKALVDVLGGFEPDVIVAPFDGFNETPFVKKALRSYAKTRGSPVAAFYYESSHPDIESPTNLYLPFTSDQMRKLQRSLAAHDTQLLRTNYAAALYHLARYAALRGRQARAFMSQARYATPLTLKILRNGEEKELTAEEARVAIRGLSARVPTVLISPHPDDDVIALGGLIFDRFARTEPGTTAIENWVMGDGADGVLKNMMPDQVRAAFDRLRSYPRDGAFYEDLEEENEAYQRAFAEPARTVTEEARRFYDSWKDLDGIFAEVQKGWNGRPSEGLLALLRKMVREDEVRLAAQTLQEGEASRVEVEWLALQASAFLHGMGDPPRAMKAHDVGRIKEKFKAFFNKYRRSIEEDAAQGRYLGLALPHPLDSHPHHRTSTELTLQALRELSEEGVVRIPILEIQYLAPWAGGYDTYLFSDRGLDGMSDNIDRDPRIPAEKKADIVRRTTAASTYAKALAILVGELAADRFGLASPTPEEMAGSGNPITGHRLKREIVGAALVDPLQRQNGARMASKFKVHETERQPRDVRAVIFDWNGTLCYGRYLSDGAMDLVRRLHSSGLKIWIASGAHSSEVDFKRSPLYKERETLLAGTFFGGDEKGNVVRRILKDEGLSPDQVVLISDDAMDIRSMVSMGVPSIWLSPSSSNSSFIRASAVVSRFGPTGFEPPVSDSILKYIVDKGPPTQSGKQKAPGARLSMRDRLHKTPGYRGNIVPVVTPLRNGKIDRESIVRLVDHLVSLGVKEILVMGYTGEFDQLNNFQRMEAIQIFSEAAYGKLRVYANVTGDTEEETMGNVEIVSSYWIKGIVIAPLFYLKDNSAIEAHVRAVHAATDKPVVLYNNPWITRGINIDPEIVGRLADIVFALKDSSGKIERLEGYAAHVRSYIGDQTKIDKALELQERQGRVRGAVASLGNISSVPQEIFTITDHAGRAALQSGALNTFSDLITSGDSTIAALKYVLNKQGIISSDQVIGKTTRIDPAKRQRIDAYLKEGARLGVIQALKNVLMEHIRRTAIFVHRPGGDKTHPVIVAWDKKRPVDPFPVQFAKIRNNVGLILRHFNVRSDSLVVEHGPIEPMIPRGHPYRVLIDLFAKQPLVVTAGQLAIRGEIAQTQALLQKHLPKDWPQTLGAVVWRQLVTSIHVYSGFTSSARGLSSELVSDHVFSEALRTVYRSLAPGGIFIVIENEPEGIELLLKRVLEHRLRYQEAHIFQAGPEEPAAAVFVKAAGARLAAKSAKSVLKKTFSAFFWMVHYIRPTRHWMPDKGSSFVDDPAFRMTPAEDTKTGARLAQERLFQHGFGRGAIRSILDSMAVALDAEKTLTEAERQRISHGAAGELWPLRPDNFFRNHERQVLVRNTAKHHALEKWTIRKLVRKYVRAEITQRQWVSPVDPKDRHSLGPRRSEVLSLWAPIRVHVLPYLSFQLRKSSQQGRLAYGVFGSWTRSSPGVEAKIFGTLVEFQPFTVNEKPRVRITNRLPWPVKIVSGARMAIDDAQYTAILKEWLENKQGTMTLIADDGERFEVRYVNEPEDDKWFGDRHRLSVMHNAIEIAYADFRTQGRQAMILTRFDSVIDNEGIRVDQRYRERYHGIGTTLMGLAMRLAKLRQERVFRLFEILQAGFFKSIGFSLFSTQREIGTERLVYNYEAPLSDGLPTIGIARRPGARMAVPDALRRQYGIIKAEEAVRELRRVLSEKESKKVIRTWNRFTRIGLKELPIPRTQRSLMRTFEGALEAARILIESDVEPETLDLVGETFLQMGHGVLLHLQVDAGRLRGLHAVFRETRRRWNDKIGGNGARLAETKGRMAKDVPTQYGRFWRRTRLARDRFVAWSRTYLRPFLSEARWVRSAALRYHFYLYFMKVTHAAHYGPAKYKSLLENWPSLVQLVQGQNVLLRPSYLEIHASEPCNLNCRFCRGELRTVPAQQSFISRTHLMGLIQSFHALNPNGFIRFSGEIGEPLLHPDIHSAFDLASELGLHWGLTTNGLLLNEAGNWLLKADFVHISVDAGNDQTYRMLKRGRTGDYERVLRNIRELDKRRKAGGSKLKIAASMVLQEANWREVDALSRDLKEAGVDVFQPKMQHFDARRRMDRRQVRDAYRLIRRVQKRDSGNGYLVEPTQGRSEAVRKLSPSDKVTSTLCYAGMLGMTMTVDPSGILKSCCQYAQRTLGDQGRITEEGLAGVWDSPQRRTVYRLSPMEHCDTCSPTDAFINEFVDFLKIANAHDPRFLAWAETNFILPMIAEWSRSGARLSASLGEKMPSFAEQGPTPSFEAAAGRVEGARLAVDTSRTSDEKADQWWELASSTSENRPYRVAWLFLSLFVGIVDAAQMIYRRIYWSGHPSFLGWTPDVTLAFLTIQIYLVTGRFARSNLQIARRLITAAHILAPILLSMGEFIGPVVLREGIEGSTFDEWDLRAYWIGGSMSYAAHLVLSRLGRYQAGARMADDPFKQFGSGMETTGAIRKEVQETLHIDTFPAGSRLAKDDAVTRQRRLFTAYEELERKMSPVSGGDEIVVFGRAGSGKTTFSEGFAEYLHGKGHDVILIQADEFFKDLTMEIAADLLILGWFPLFRWPMIDGEIPDMRLHLRRYRFFHDLRMAQADVVESREGKSSFFAQMRRPHSHGERDNVERRLITVKKNTILIYDGDYFSYLMRYLKNPKVIRIKSSWTGAFRNYHRREVSRQMPRGWGQKLRLALLALVGIVLDRAAEKNAASLDADQIVDLSSDGPVVSNNGARLSASLGEKMPSFAEQGPATSFEAAAGRVEARMAEAKRIGVLEDGELYSIVGRDSRQVRLTRPLKPGMIYFETDTSVPRPASFKAMRKFVEDFGAQSSDVENFMNTRVDAVKRQGIDAYLTEGARLTDAFEAPRRIHIPRKFVDENYYSRHPRKTSPHEWVANLLKFKKIDSSDIRLIKKWGMILLMIFLPSILKHAFAADIQNLVLNVMIFYLMKMMINYVWLALSDIFIDEEKIEPLTEAYLSHLSQTAEYLPPGFETLLAGIQFAFMGSQGRFKPKAVEFAFDGGFWVYFFPPDWKVTVTPIHPWPYWIVPLNRPAPVSRSVESKTALEPALAKSTGSGPRLSMRDNRQSIDAYLKGGARMAAEPDIKQLGRWMAAGFLAVLSVLGFAGWYVFHPRPESEKIETARAVTPSEYWMNEGARWTQLHETVESYRAYLKASLHQAEATLPAIYEHSLRNDLRLDRSRFYALSSALLTNSVASLVDGADLDQALEEEIMQLVLEFETYAQLKEKVPELDREGMSVIVKTLSDLAGRVPAKPASTGGGRLSDYYGQIAELLSTAPDVKRILTRVLLRTAAVTAMYLALHHHSTSRASSAGARLAFRSVRHPITPLSQEEIQKLTPRFQSMRDMGYKAWKSYNPDSKLVLFIRHVEPFLTDELLRYEQTDTTFSPPTFLGKRQAKALAAVLTPYLEPVSDVEFISSPRERSSRSIEPTARALGLPVELMPELREVARVPEVMSGLKGSLVELFFQAHLEEIDNDPIKYRFRETTGYSGYAVLLELHAVLDRLKATKKVSVVSSHGRKMILTMMEMYGIPSNKFRAVVKHLGHPSFGSISAYAYHPPTDTWELLVWNDRLGGSQRSHRGGIPGLVRQAAFRALYLGVASWRVLAGFDDPRIEDAYPSWDVFWRPSLAEIRRRLDEVKKSGARLADILNISVPFSSQMQRTQGPVKGTVLLKGGPVRIYQTMPAPVLRRFPNRKYVDGFNDGPDSWVAEHERMAPFLEAVKEPDRERIIRGRVLLQGPGRFMYEPLFLIDSFPQARSIFIMDGRLENLLFIKDELEKRNDIPHSKIILFHADFSATPFPDGFFDLVYSNNTYSTEYERYGLAESLDELMRILSSEGVFLTSGSHASGPFLKKGMHLVWHKGHLLSQFLASKTTRIFTDETLEKTVPYQLYSPGNPMGSWWIVDDPSDATTGARLADPQWPVPSPNPYSKTINLIRGFAELDSMFHGSIGASLHKASVQAGKEKRAARVLVIGAGAGRIVWDIESQFSDVKVTAVNRERIALEPSDYLAHFPHELTDAQIRDFAARFDKEARIQDVDGGLLGHPDASYDVVIVAQEVLMYVRQKALLLAEMKRVLKKEGEAFVGLQGFRVEGQSDIRAFFDALNRHSGAPEYRIIDFMAGVSFSRGQLVMRNIRPDIQFPVLTEVYTESVSKRDLPDTFYTTYHWERSGVAEAGARLAVPAGPQPAKGPHDEPIPGAVDVTPESPQWKMSEHLVRSRHFLGEWKRWKQENHAKYGVMLDDFMNARAYLSVSMESYKQARRAQRLITQPRLRANAGRRIHRLRRAVFAEYAYLLHRLAALQPARALALERSAKMVGAYLRFQDHGNTRIPVVDEEGLFTGSTVRKRDRFSLPEGRYTHAAVVGLARTKNGKTQFLLQKRGPGVSVQSGAWDATVAGRREMAGRRPESIETTATREIWEETDFTFWIPLKSLIHLNDLNLRLHFSTGRATNVRHSFFLHWVSAEEERQLENMIDTWRPNDEVSGWRWMDEDEIRAGLQADILNKYDDREYAMPLLKFIQSYDGYNQVLEIFEGARLAADGHEEDNGFRSPIAEHLHKIRRVMELHRPVQTRLKRTLPRMVYLPSPEPQAYRMLRVLRRKKVLGPGKYFADLGSGDGMVVHLANVITGADVTGIEMDPRMVQEAQKLTRRLREESVVASDDIHWVTGQAEHQDLSKYDVLYVYASYSGIDTETIKRLRPGAILIIMNLPSDSPLFPEYLEPLEGYLPHENKLPWRVYRRKDAGARLSQDIATLDDITANYRRDIDSLLPRFAKFVEYFGYTTMASDPRFGRSVVDEMVRAGFDPGDGFAAWQDRMHQMARIAELRILASPDRFLRTGNEDTIAFASEENGRLIIHISEKAFLDFRDRSSAGEPLLLWGAMAHALLAFKYDQRMAEAYRGALAYGMWRTETGHGTGARLSGKALVAKLSSFFVKIAPSLPAAHAAEVPIRMNTGMSQATPDPRVETVIYYLRQEAKILSAVSNNKNAPYFEAIDLSNKATAQRHTERVLSEVDTDSAEGARLTAQLKSNEIRRNLELAAIDRKIQVVLEFHDSMFKDAESERSFGPKASKYMTKNTATYIIRKGEPVPAEFAQAPRVQVFAPGSGFAQPGAIHMPAEAFTGDIQDIDDTFFDLGGDTGRIDPTKAPDEYLMAYSTMAGVTIGRDTLVEIREGRAMITIKPVLMAFAAHAREVGARLATLNQSA